LHRHGSSIHRPPRVSRPRGSRRARGQRRLCAPPDRRRSRGRGYNAEARSRHRPGQRCRRSRSPRVNIRGRCPCQVQPVRHPRAAPSRRYAPPRSGDHLAARGADYLAAHASEGVLWHDGARFTAVDAKYSLDRTFDASVKAARLLPMFQTIDRTEAPDSVTLIIHTKQPDALLLARLAWCGQVVPWAYIDRVGFTVFNQRPVGTGPLRFVSWTPGDRCVLETNPDYWDGRLDLDRVVFRSVPDPAGRAEALLRGDADLITGLTPEHRDRVATHSSTRVVGTPYAGLYVLVVNVTVAPLNDPLVRQALSLAID